MEKSKNIEELIAKYLKDKCSKTELDKFLDFVQKADREELHSQFLNIWEKDQFQTHEITDLELDSMLDSIHHKINLEKNIKHISISSRILKFTTKLAAILFIPLMIGSIWFINKEHSLELVQNNIILETPWGSRVRTVLPDGTEIWQNAGSRLEYPAIFDPKAREVFLRGEAYFNVKTDKDHPFYINTKMGRVKVTGTKFNIRCYDDENYTSVALETGRLYFTHSSSKHPQVLLPGERIEYNNKTGKHKLYRCNIENYTCWKKGILSFKDKALKDVIIDLQRWYNVDIKILDKELKNMTFTMSVESATIDKVLEYISYAAPIKVSVEQTIKQKNTIPKRKFILKKK